MSRPWNSWAASSLPGVAAKPESKMKQKNQSISRTVVLLQLCLRVAALAFFVVLLTPTLLMNEQSGRLASSGCAGTLKKFYLRRPTSLPRSFQLPPSPLLHSALTLYYRTRSVPFRFHRSGLMGKNSPVSCQAAPASKIQNPDQYTHISVWGAIVSLGQEGPNTLDSTSQFSAIIP